MINLYNHIIKTNIPSNIPITLGSSSSNRRKIIKYLGWNISYDKPDIDEKQIRCDNPYDLPLKIAIAKANKLYTNLTNETLLITCDQIVLCNELVLEKPENIKEAYSFFKSYSNNQIKIINGIVITHFPSAYQISNVDVSTIYFNEISEENIKKIITNKDIFSSAGGIIIEDNLVYSLIKHIEGSISSIMGLNYELVINMINEMKARLCK
jgi:septum formation protein